MLELEPGKKSVEGNTLHVLLLCFIVFIEHVKPG